MKAFLFRSIEFQKLRWAEEKRLVSIKYENILCCFLVRDNSSKKSPKLKKKKFLLKRVNWVRDLWTLLDTVNTYYLYMYVNAYMLILTTYIVNSMFSFSLKDKIRLENKRKMCASSHNLYTWNSDFKTVRIRYRAVTFINELKNKKIFSLFFANFSH